MTQQARRSSGFTLIELILVMVILTVLMAIVAPSLSNSIQGHKLDQETTRFLALTEYARNEAISQGVPMVIWIDKATQQFGVDPKTDYNQSQTHRSYRMNEEVRFDSITPNQTKPNGQVIEFEPDGTPSTDSVTAIRLADRRGHVADVIRRDDGTGFALASTAAR